MNKSMRGAAAIQLNKTIIPSFEIIDGFRSTKVDATNNNTYSHSVLTVSDSREIGSKLFYKIICLTFIALTIILVSMQINTLIEHKQNVINASSTVSTCQLIVHSGDNLWTIAENNPIKGLSTFETVQYLKNINQLDESIISPGDILLVPSQHE